ncbi:hypothetical protein [Geopsychrobacter electrodiphilus]|uniref:hypothetical protein n=1 Tax=Geopsychrobacter electrodiphilus TaxID=225196 RepID=UPI00036F0B2D|nr:hypothetical protein [Geopsychrobacter electrodiphilus]
MAKDPICGMEVSEEGAEHMLHFAHESVYFCSKVCKETYAQQAGLAKPAAKKGVIGRFLAKLAKENEQSNGGKPPSCH